MLVVGIALGAKAVEGEKVGVWVCGLSAVLALLFSAREPSGRAGAIAGLLSCGSLGFVEGRVTIARREELAHAAFVALPKGAERADRVEGILVDFWSDAPPRARGRLRAERLRIAGEWRPFPAEVFVFVSGTIPPESAADRGDRVSIGGHLRREEVPASERDVALPWTRYRISVKSTLQIRRESATVLSMLSFPNRVLSGRLPAVGSRGPWFERNVRGPLAALLLGRTSQLD
ncbi:MAG TPA: hypothetical protein VKS03_02605, partial [Thermoanaerobaculia bacterium]|nr:hypothetical protein [Thermoanaerobaculia bacterium]